QPHGPGAAGGVERACSSAWAWAGVGTHSGGRGVWRWAPHTPPRECVLGPCLNSPLRCSAARGRMGHSRATHWPGSSGGIVRPFGDGGQLGADGGTAAAVGGPHAPSLLVPCAGGRPRGLLLPRRRCCRQHNTRTG